MKKLTCWESPEFEALRMDAEVGSYHEDSGPPRDFPPFAEGFAEDALDRDER